MPQGYGVLSVGRFRVSAHRYSYRLHYGRKPWSIVDHLCHSYSRDCRGGPSCPHRLCIEPCASSRSSRPPKTRAGCPAIGSIQRGATEAVRLVPDTGIRGISTMRSMMRAGRRVCVWCVTGVRSRQAMEIDRRLDSTWFSRCRSRRVTCGKRAYGGIGRAGEVFNRPRRVVENLGPLLAGGADSQRGKSAS